VRGAASTAFFLAALSVLVSVYSRTVREALFLAYALEGLWLLGPEAFRRQGFRLGGLWYVLSPLNDWLLALNPVSVVPPAAFGLLTGSNVFVYDLSWMIALQFAAGAGFVGLASWRLRPVFRRQEEGRRPSSEAAAGRAA